MNYVTCRGCGVDKASCARRAEVRNGIKGLGLTSVKHSCPQRVPAFIMGQRVSFKTRIGGDWDGEEFVFYGTVLKESKPGRFKISVDAGRRYEDEPLVPDDFENKSGYVSMSFLNMRPLDEPARRVCPTCEAQVDFGEECQSSRFFSPSGCIRPTPTETKGMK